MFTAFNPSNYFIIIIAMTSGIAQVAEQLA